MNIQQREDVAAPATNFTALRARRNILANSDVGVMVLNKEVDGPDLQPPRSAPTRTSGSSRTSTSTACWRRRFSPDSRRRHERQRRLRPRRLFYRGNRTRDARGLHVCRHALQRRARLHPADQHRQDRRLLRAALPAEARVELAARNLPALPDGEHHARRQRRLRLALHGLAPAVHAAGQLVHRAWTEYQPRSADRAVPHQQQPRDLDRTGPLRVRRGLHPLELESRGARVVHRPLRPGTSTTATSTITAPAPRSA